MIKILAFGAPVCVNTWCNRPACDQYAATYINANEQNPKITSAIWTNKNMKNLKRIFAKFVFYSSKCCLYSDSHFLSIDFKDLKTSDLRIYWLCVAKRERRINTFWVRFYTQKKPCSKHLNSFDMICICCRFCQLVATCCG